jgi:hypothetical protein
MIRQTMMPHGQLPCWQPVLLRPGRYSYVRPRGQVPRVPRVPGATANFNWGDDYKGLFITASTSLYRIRVKVPGCPSPF